MEKVYSVAGFFAVWSQQPLRTSDDLLVKTLRQCDPLGRCQHVVNNHVSLVTWRRDRGEFPESGTLQTSQSGRQLAWVGQVLSETGDATAGTITHELNANDPFADPQRHNGPFVSAWVNAAGTQINVCNDRFGHYPLYLCASDDRVVVSTHWEVVLTWLHAPKISLTALNLFLRTGELIDDLTLVEGVRFVRGGTQIEISNNRTEIKPYWHLHHSENHSLTLENASKECGELLRAGVKRVADANPRIGVPLSGGLDSRFLLGLCPDPASVPSFTMGLKGCRDLTYAKQFAEVIGSPHSEFEWQPSLFPPMWPEGVAVTAGAVSVADMFMLPYSREFAKQCDVVLNGLAGDAVLGGNFTKLKWLRSTSLRDLADHSWHWRVSPRVDGQVDGLLNSKSSSFAAKTLWIDSLAAGHGESPALRLMDWLVSNRVFRFTNCGTALLRRDVESHSPFFDNDFIDYLTTVPLKYRYKHRLYIRSLTETCKPAARVPWQRTAIAPSLGFASQMVSLTIHKGLAQVDKKLKTSLLESMKVADVGGWLRSGSWATAAREILTNSLCLERNLYCPDSVIKLLDSHERGQDESVLIGRMITIELLARNIDKLQ